MGDLRRRRMELVLTLFAAEGFDAIVLGAWGCGVFRNDPVEVAQEFRTLLERGFSSFFAHVSFAVIDEKTWSIFHGVFSGQAVKSFINAPWQHQSTSRGKGTGKDANSTRQSRIEGAEGYTVEKQSSRKAKRWA